jgi:hypothetical protein
MVRRGRDVIAAQTRLMTRRAYNRHDIRKRKNSLIRSSAKLRPVSYMPFRPEEMNTASCVRPVFRPILQGDINIAVDFVRTFAFNDPVTNNYSHGFTTVQTWRVNLYRFTRKDPADRQGFKASLRKPLLLSVNSNAVLRRHIVERCK